LFTDVGGAGEELGTADGIQEQVEQYMIRGCTFTYLDDDTSPYHQSPRHVNSSQNWDCVILIEMDGQH
jgi:hypothetical protein